MQEQLGLTASKNYAFIRRLLRVHPVSVQAAHATRAQRLLARFNLQPDRVRAISETLALFHSWVSRMAIT